MSLLGMDTVPMGAGRCSLACGMVVVGVLHWQAEYENAWALSSSGSDHRRARSDAILSRAIVVRWRCVVSLDASFMKVR